MKYIDINLPNELDEVRIIPLFDLHIGSPQSNLRLITKYLQQDAYFILGGDLIDASIKNSIGNVYHQEMTPQEQLDKLVEIFEPCKERIIGICSGNHEQRINREVGIDILQVFAQLIQREKYYDPDSLLIHIRLGKNRHAKKTNYTFYVVHGWSGARKPGGKMNAIQELRGVILADIYLVGHSHLKGILCEDFLLPDHANKVITRVQQYFIGVGSFLNYGDYAERRGLSIAQLGAPFIILSGREKNIRVILEGEL